MVRGKGLIFTQQEVDDFRVRSHARCPTYGCCRGCWEAGPVGKRCVTCTKLGEYILYGVVYYFTGKNKRKIVDAEHLIEKFGARLASLAKADRMCDWTRTPDSKLNKAIIEKMLIEMARRDAIDLHKKLEIE